MGSSTFVSSSLTHAICPNEYLHRASKAKVQRLEKERREMEKTIEGFRKSQAKLAELEKTNKKLQV